MDEPQETPRIFQKQQTEGGRKAFLSVLFQPTEAAAGALSASAGVASAKASSE